MDPSSVLEQTTQDVSNLQAEFKHILEEIRATDIKFYENKKQYLQRDSQIHKFIKQHSSLTENPKEAEFYEKIEKDMDRCHELQQEKCVLANTALFLVTKHLSKLQKNIEALEDDNLLAPLDEEKDVDSGVELSRESSVLSTTSERKRRATGTSSSSSRKKKPKPERGSSRQRDSTPSGGISDVNDNNFDIQDYNDDLFSGYNQGEEDDKQLYCFCQSVSYGEMVACDGENCKYEWFHYTCVNLKEPPKGAWYCPECRQEIANSRLKKKKGLT